MQTVIPASVNTAKVAVNCPSVSQVPWNFGDEPDADQAAASSLVGVTAMVASRAARRAGRYR